VRFASLPMYDLPEVRAATDALWADLASRLRVNGVIDVPDALMRDGTDDLLAAHWRHPQLLLTQSCGWPVAAVLAAEVAVVGAFTYRGVSDGDAHYATHLVVRAGDGQGSLANRPVAVNGRDSLSGWVSLRAAVGDVGPVLITGSHAESLASVRDGRADLASIDPVTWALLAHYRPAALNGLAIVGHGPRVPCLPLITHRDHGPGVEVLRAALAGVRSEPLLIDGFVPLGAGDYAPVAHLAPPT
jgi:ABC-type phosphate/phosphonate transport system substrate-binding protein